MKKKYIYKCTDANIRISTELNNFFDDYAEEIVYDILEELSDEGEIYIRDIENNVFNNLMKITKEKLFKLKNRMVEKFRQDMGVNKIVKYKKDLLKNKKI